ncbi:matrixin family metalloprotease [Candidatus Saccharibacteria bacterium]|nr:matrixin family metalloprotease [Candidatus Saccharibacteria bacterium]
MKKFTILAGSAALLTLLLWALPTFAKDRPKGLTDRGPLTKITFIHYKKGYAKPPWAGGGGRNESKCYAFLSKGAKWKTAEEYLMNPTNSDGMSSSFVQSAVTAGVDEWEGYGGNIFGSGSLDSGASYNNGDLDGVNTTSFGFYLDDGVIAVTSVWGYFYGPPKTRELVEWDMLFNEHFTWGDADVNASLMDLQNIATHELGHSAGLADLYETSCNLETMYGYSSEGETIKRDLNTGDIQGIEELYK